MAKKPIEPGAQALAGEVQSAHPLPAQGGVYHYVDGVLVPQDGGPVVDDVMASLGEQDEK